MSYILYHQKKKKLEEFSHLPQNILMLLYQGIYYLPLSDDNKKIQIKINQTRKFISKIESQLPLYDIYTKNIYLIHAENLYQRVIYENYRFPNKFFYQKLQKKNQRLMSAEQAKKMIIFLNNYDLEVLENTFVNALYQFSNQLGKNITFCQRPSFNSQLIHLQPYYHRNEIINLALNMNLIKPSKKYYTSQMVNELCTQVSHNDISDQILIDHRNYIIKNKSAALIQYYTLQGSYFMNNYLRQIGENTIWENKLLEEHIKKMWDLILNSPAFDQEYTVYRFVDTDEYINALKIGEIFEDPGFVSTTRDPFYRNEHYVFGFILIKIKLPAHKKGTGLCLEIFSHFPEEQEIVLPPKTKLKLISRNDDCSYFHIDRNQETKIKTRYEFELIPFDEKKNQIQSTKIYQPLTEETKLIDFLTMTLTGDTMTEKIYDFLNRYVNKIYQCKTMIGDKEIPLITEWFNSKNVYEKFYHYKQSSNAFSIYSLYNHRILFYLEFVDINNSIHVNYYFRFSENNISDLISDEDLILFLAKIGYAFKVDKIILFHDYKMCYHLSINEIGNFNLDIYHYLKDQTKRFDQIPELKPYFHYYQLDKLHTKPVTDLLSLYDRDELYQIHLNHPQYDTIAKFYLFMIEKYCHLLPKLISKMGRIFNLDNPFETDYYLLEAFLYLYNRNLIESIPSIKNIKEDELLFTEPLNKNRYRNQYVRRRSLSPENIIDK